MVKEVHEETENKPPVDARDEAEMDIWGKDHCLDHMAIPVAGGPRQVAH